MTILRSAITTYLNLEMAATEEMLKVALGARPDAVSLVAENPNEITTEGGLNVVANIAIVRAAVSKLRQGGDDTQVSLLIRIPSQIEAAHDIGAQQVELCTAAYAEATLGSRATHGEGASNAAKELRRLRNGAELAAQYGLHVAAGHGLTYRNVGAVAAITEITEFNIGHNIIARSIFGAGACSAGDERRDCGGQPHATAPGKMLFKLAPSVSSLNSTLSENEKGRPEEAPFVSLMVQTLAFSRGQLHEPEPAQNQFEPARVPLHCPSTYLVVFTTLARGTSLGRVNLFRTFSDFCQHRDVIVSYFNKTARNMQLKGFAVFSIGKNASLQL